MFEKGIDKLERLFYTNTYQQIQKKQGGFMDQIITLYYENNAQKLRNMVDKILYKLGFAGLVDYEDFYSLANEIFVDVIKRYDGSRPFDGFLYTCLSNKFKTEMTRRNRQKRQADRMVVSIDTPMGDDENSTLGDMIADKISVETEIFEKNEEGYSRKMMLYLSRLSNLQKEILRLTAVGYMPNEIREELHISEKRYSDCKEAIHSYRNVEILF